MKIGIKIIGTNAYFPLALMFIKKFTFFYTGNKKIKFYFFSDNDPKPYLPNNINYKFIKQSHSNWLEGTNSKFANIISLEKEDFDYLYYFDADTNIDNHFDETWFLGEMVGSQHFEDDFSMKEQKNYDRNPKSKAFIPFDTKLPQTYYLGSFFGGKKEKVLNFCKILREWQLEDKKIPYEPDVNDESYINKFFHLYPPKTILCKDFKFITSDKRGISDTRDVKLDISIIKKDLIKYKNILNIDIVGGKVISKE